MANTTKEFELKSKIRKYIYDIDEVAKKIDRKIRPIYGDQLRNESLSIIKYLEMANSSCGAPDLPRNLIIQSLEKRALLIDDLLAQLRSVEFLIDLVSDKRYISEGASARLISQAAIINRMTIAWSKQTKEKLKSIILGE